MKRKLIALLLSVALCFSLSANAFAVISNDPVNGPQSEVETKPEEKPDPKPEERPGPSSRDDDDDDDGYSVNVSTQIKGGKVRANPNSAEKGKTVTLTVTPDDGYQLSKLTVTDSKGKALEVKDLGGGKYSFVMPGSQVKVDASFTRIAAAPSVSFTDVPSSAYYASAVAWAVERGITSGKTATTFAPNDPCTRAQIVTFLWRASGSPAASGGNPFTDVAPGAYYYEAVLWAVQKGITSGTTATTFSPNSPCTRGQAVTFLHRMEGTPAASGSAAFADVAQGSYCYDAVRWAVEKGVTAGVTATTFAPNNTCTRAQIMTFLYRDMA